MKSFDAIVIGQGYAGLFAAKLCAQASLNTANFESDIFGGLIININELDPGPREEPISGAELASDLAMANMDQGVTAVSERITAVERQGDGSFVVRGDSQAYATPRVIVATGARFRKLGIAGESEFAGRGVSHCGDCDGPMVQGKEVAVIGGGDSAFQEALVLAAYCNRVTMIYQEASPRACAQLVERVAANPKIRQVPLSRPLAIVGQDGVDGLRFAREGEGEQTLGCSGVFLFAGLTPNTGFLPPEVERGGASGIATSDTRESSVPGLWAIGAVREGYGGRLSHAEEDAMLAVAALKAR